MSGIGRTAVYAASALAILGAATGEAQEAGRGATAPDPQWQPLVSVLGLDVVDLAAGRAKPRSSVFRFPASTVFHQYAHPYRRTYTIDPETWYLGWCIKLDEPKTKPFAAGNSYTELADLAHDVATRSGPAKK